LRIAVLGDFHLKDGKLDLTEKAMEDIAACSPDLVVPLGDFGNKECIGGPEGLEQASSYLRTIGRPVRAIMGNHDLQRETGGGNQKSGTMEQAFTHSYFLTSPYGVMEETDYRLFFVSTDVQPADSCYQIQECYVSDAQFDYIVGKLKERPGVPAIFFTHAPPIGSGLRTVPHVHVRSTNAYLDQNHNPFRWLELIKDYPEIVLWFSAHYHLSHRYPDSTTHKHGTAFFTTGVHGAATRDSMRQSRIIDIGEDRVEIKTLDHEERRILVPVDWTSAGPLAELVQQKREVLFAGPGNSRFPSDSIGSTAPFPSGSAMGPGRSQDHYHCCSSGVIGDGAALNAGLVSVDGERWLAAAEDGYLWELLPQLDAVMGTLNFGKPVSCIVAQGDYVWFAVDNFVYVVDMRDPWRFVRKKEDDRERVFAKLKLPVNTLTTAGADSVWACSGTSLFKLTLYHTGSSLSVNCKLYDSLPDIAAKLNANNDRLQLLTQSGILYDWHMDRFEQSLNNVVACDQLDDEEACIVMDQGSCTVYYQNRNLQKSVPLENAGQQQSAASVVCLGDSKVLLNINGSAIVWDSAIDELKPVPARGQVTAISRGHSGTSHQSFAIAIGATGPFSRPQLQIWSSIPVR
jgi:hypothetical protein